MLAKSLRNERSESLSAVGSDVISVIISGTSVVMVDADVEVPLLALLCLGSVVLLLHLPLFVVVIVVVLMVVVSSPSSSKPSPSVIVSEAIGRSWSRVRSRGITGTSGGEAIGLLIGQVDQVWSDVLDCVDESLEGFRGHGYIHEVDRLS